MGNSNMGGGNSGTNSVQGHYISERIERTIEKFSKKQIIKNNSPFMNQNGKSRNFNQSNSASKIYSSTVKNMVNNKANLNASPYMNGGVYQTQLQQPSDFTTMIETIQPSFEERVHQQQQQLKELRQQQLEHSADRKLNDLSFESPNPLNNSYTNGERNNNYQSVNKISQTLAAEGSNYPLNQVQVKIQFQKKFNKLEQRQQYQGSSSSDYILNSNINSNNFDINQTNNYPYSKNPHIQWWSQQMNSQQFLPPASAGLNSNLDSSNNLYQLQQYPQSVQASPFQQAKSRDGGYRNIPIRDMSSISDQSPQKQVIIDNNGISGVNIEQQENHPFKGPKLHLFKKGNSRRIKTSSATRNLQPIYPLDNKINVNFNSINTGGVNSTQNQSALYYQTNKNQSYDSVDQENQYITLSQTKNFTSFTSIKKINPFSNNIQVSNNNHFSGVTIDVYSNNDLHNNYGNNYEIQNITLKNQLQMRPNTTSLDQLLSEVSPKRQMIFNGNLQSNSNNQLEPSNGVQNLSKVELQEEINGFKHSFYNDKSTSTIKNKSPTNQMINQDSDRQREKVNEYSNISHQNNNESIKHIFVLNVESNKNLASNQQSTQESKAMTPCFIHTPNMTNKWGNFKAKDSNNNDNQKAEDKETLFVKDKSIKGLPQAKKPMTSHQSKTQSINEAISDTKSKSKDKLNTNINNANKSDNIKLGPEDIYLVNGLHTQSSRNPSSLNSKSNKPQTSNSFRRPLSRNHPILNINSQQTQKNNIVINNTDKIIYQRSLGVAGMDPMVQFQPYKLQQNQTSSIPTNGLIKEQLAEEETEQ